MPIVRQEMPQDTRPQAKLFSPQATYPGQFLGRFYQNPLLFLQDLASYSHPVSFCRLAGQKIFLVNQPDLIKDLFASHYQRFRLQGRWSQRAKRILGESLFTSTGDIHRQKRRIIQPVFHHERLKSYSNLVISYALKLSEGWHDGEQINLTAQMMTTSWLIVTEALFGGDVGAEAERIGELMTKIVHSFFYCIGPLSPLLRLIGHPRTREAPDARDELDQIIQRMIDIRRNSRKEKNDVLSLLLAAQDEGNGLGMSDAETRDETRVLLLAGHESTATVLCWTLFLLAQHIEVTTKLRREVSVVLGKSSPAIADLEKMPFLNQVIRESLRLYPPVYMILREVSEAFRLADISIPKDSILIVSPWTTQRSERFYPDPLRFQPERWTPEFRNSIPKYAFFPFGGGPKQCIGEGFAWMELLVMLAILVRDWDFHLLPGQNIHPKPGMTLRSNQPIQMIVKRAA